MYLLIITTTTVLVTFLLNPLFKNINKTFKRSSSGLHIHHSVIGTLLVAIGLVISNQSVIGIGLGIYIAHGIEEIHYNKTHPLKAFFVFVTR